MTSHCLPQPPPGFVVVDHGRWFFFVSNTRLAEDSWPVHFAATPDHILRLRGVARQVTEELNG